MKITSVLVIAVSLTMAYSNAVYAQTPRKILFDATKAESAGNADWVIDADAHNLGYGNGPAQLGSGNEANPQRYPTPLQSTVTSTTAQGYWEGGISAWGIDMVKQGYEVETLPYNVPITYGNVNNVQDLSNYNVFVVCEPNIQFTAAEKTAILNFVQNGGGLFMVADHDQSDRNNDGIDAPHVWNDLMSSNNVASNPFGMTFNLDSYSGNSTNLANLPADSCLHGPQGNCTEVKWSSGATMTLSTSQNATVTGLAFKSGSSQTNTNALCARAYFGAGRVFGMGDSSPCDDASGDPNDVLYDGWITDASGNHEKLIVNATIWLAGQATTHVGLTQTNTVKDPFLVYPNPATAGQTVHITGDFTAADTEYEFRWFDVLGQPVKSAFLNGNTSFTATAPAAGFYYSTLYKNGIPVNTQAIWVQE